MPSKALLPNGEKKIPPPLDQEIVESKTERLRKETRSSRHQLLHYTKNPYCKICQEAKPYQVQGRCRDPPEVEKSKKFGDLVLADHMVIKNQDAMGKDGERDGRMVNSSSGLLSP